MKFFFKNIVFFGLILVGLKSFSGYGVADVEKLWDKDSKINLYLMPQSTNFRTSKAIMESRIQDAIDEFEDKTSFEFEIVESIPSNQQYITIEFLDSEESMCWSSSIGRNSNVAQNIIQLEFTCSSSNISHEILHALGLFHEHQRPDRDSFIKISPETSRHNIITEGRLLGPYDFKSLVHYSSSSIPMVDNNGDTVTDSNGDTVYITDSNNNLISDILKLNDNKIDSNNPSGLSVEDVNSLERLYHEKGRSMIFVPEHNVFVSDHELTLTEFREFNNNQYIEVQCWRYGIINDCSVADISWVDVENYIAALNASTDKSFPNGTYRMCSVEEWNSAAKYQPYDGVGDLYDYNAISTGDYYCATQDNSCLNKSSIYNGNSYIGGNYYSRTFTDLKNGTEKSNFVPNALQIWNMYGNVSEWVLDDLGNGHKAILGGSFGHSAESLKKGIYWSASKNNKSMFDGVRLCAVSNNNELDSMVKIKKDSSKGVFNDFFISDHEVTVGEFNKYSSVQKASFDCDSDDCPVVYVSHEEIEDYIIELNYAVTGPNNNDFRLCGNDEWDLASRAGTTGKYSCNYDSNDSTDCLDEIAYYSANSDFNAHQVRHKRANLNGIFDMHGNVKELVVDEFGLYKGRGASFGHSAYYLSNDFISTDTKSSKYHGFRLCADF